MRIFLTGATGYIGSAVAGALQCAGHRVVGLTHSPGKAAGLEAVGIEPVVGDLKEPRAFQDKAAGCDVLVHAAFEYSPEGAKADRTALDALIAAARSSGQPRLLVYTSGVWVLGPRAERADEATPPEPIEAVAWRPAHEAAALEAAGPQLSVAVVRPGCVYGRGGGLYGQMIQAAVEDRKIRLVGDGSNRWSTVYIDDLADLYRLVAEKRPARGIFHATDGGSEMLRAQASALAMAAGGAKVELWPLAEAKAALGPMAEALALDQRVSSDKTRRELRWRVTRSSVARNANDLVAQWRKARGAKTTA